MTNSSLLFQADAANPYNALLDQRREALCVPDVYSREWAELVMCVSRVNHRIEALWLAQAQLSDEAKAQLVDQIAEDRESKLNEIEHRELSLKELKALNHDHPSHEIRQAAQAQESKLKRLRVEVSSDACNARYLAALEGRRMHLERTQARYQESVDEVEAWAADHPETTHARG